MPSVNVKLPKYVVAKPRKDGTFRVLFEVPARLRPSGWLPTMPTPPVPHRTGKLDAAEVAAIKAHVEGPGGLLEQLEACRRQEAPPPVRTGTVEHLAAIWQASEEWAALKPRTQAFYRSTLAIIQAWSAANGHPPVTALQRPAIVALLRLYNDRQAQRQSLRATLRALLEVAINEGWRTDNPASGFRLTRTQKKRAVTEWKAADVALYARVAREIGWPGGARMLRLMWETSADASDVVTWRRDRNLVDGTPAAVEYDRGKTAVPAKCPISRSLADELRGDLYFVTGRNGLPYLPDDVRDDRRRSTDFRVLRRAVVAAGGRALLMDHLRHSAATDAVACGSSPDEAASITAHVDGAMNRRVYVQKIWSHALDVQRRRGIIE